MSEYIKYDECRDNFYNAILGILSTDSTNDRANQIIDLFDDLPTVDVRSIVGNETMITNKNEYKWTSVKDRLPDKEGSYFCVDIFNEHKIIDIYDFTKNLKKIVDGDYGTDYEFTYKNHNHAGFYDYNSETGCFYNVKVDYWLPIPEVPETRRSNRHECVS